MTILKNLEKALTGKTWLSDPPRLFFFFLFIFSDPFATVSFDYENSERSTRFRNSRPFSGFRLRPETGGERGKSKRYNRNEKRK